jgi:hypothetical protein
MGNHMISSVESKNPELKQVECKTVATSEWGEMLIKGYKISVRTKKFKRSTCTTC